MKEEKKKKGRFAKIKEIVKDIKNNPQKKGILFLGIYFIFFLLVIMSLRTSNTINQEKSKEKISSNFEYSLKNIKNNNYSFKYTEVLDNNLVMYSGDQLFGNSRFNKTYNNIVEQYYDSNGIFLKKELNGWMKVNNPYIFKELRDIHKIEKILKRATFISKTEYKEQTKTYNYQISTTTLVDLIDNQKVDLDDNINTIVLTTNSENEVVKIEFNLTPYTNYKQLSTVLGTVQVEYTNFGKIEKIEEPQS